jgi:hypothetical protein
MAEQPKLTAATVLMLVQVATLVQTIVLVLLATEKIRPSVAVPLLALVVIFGLIPAGAFAKSKRSE